MAAVAVAGATYSPSRAWRIEMCALIASLPNNPVDRAPVKARQRFTVAHRPGAAHRERYVEKTKENL